MRKILFLLCFGSSFSSHARWMLPSESDVSVLSKKITIQVAENGSSVEVTTQRIKILNERGRVDWGTWRFNYTPKNVKLQILLAKATMAGNEYVVDKNDIVDTPINATETGFDESRQIVVPFSQVQVGTVIEIVTRQEVFRPYFPNHFSERHFFGDYNLQEKGEIEISSARPLYFQINDPLKVLDFKKSEDTRRKKFSYRVVLKKPVVRRVFEEIDPVLPDEKLVWFAVSTAKTYDEMFRSMAVRYQAILDEKLPEKFDGIVADARKIKDPIEQVNYVLAAVADRVRYMGDWRSVDGALVPRHLEQIVKTRFGDCKDLSTLTTKMFRMLGLKADVAFIYRGKPPYILPTVPFMGFNHAITTIQLADRRLWVDPTNFQSFADGVFEDIGHRQALILSLDKLELARVEFTLPEKNLEHWKWNLKLKPGQKRQDEVTLVLTGTEAVSATGAELTYSKKRFETETVANLANMSEVTSYKFKPYDLRSRIVRPIRLELTIDQHYQPLETSMGPAIGIESLRDLGDITRVDPKERQAHMLLNMPNTVRFDVTLENFNTKGDAIKDCSASSPWIDYALTVSADKKTIVRTATTKVYWISVDEIRSEAFKKFQSALRKCTRGRYFVYTPLD